MNTVSSIAHGYGIDPQELFDRAKHERAYRYKFDDEIDSLTYIYLCVFATDIARRKNA